VDKDVTVGMTYWYWLENPADGQRYGPTSVTAQAEAPAKMRVFLPFITR
jgi:hypothetical protein